MAKKKTNGPDALKVVVNIPIHRVTAHVVKEILARTYGWTPEKEAEDGMDKEAYIARKISQVLSRDYIKAAAMDAYAAVSKRTSGDIEVDNG